MTINLPKWFWWILAIVLIIIICVVFKINAHIGSEGLGVTQGLVH
jgi:hypothetical protein